MECIFITISIIVLCCASGVIGYLIGIRKGFDEMYQIAEDTEKDLRFLNKLTSGGKPEDSDFT